MVKVYSLDQLNQVFLFIRDLLLFHFDSKVSFEGFPPLSATLASGVKYNTLPCRSYTTAHHVKCNINMFRVSPAPAPRSILVKKVTFQRREGESSSGSRFNMTCLYPLLSIPPQTIFQPSSGGSLGASQSGYLDMASLREDIAGSIVREPPPYPRYSVDTVQWCIRYLPK